LTLPHGSVRLDDGRRAAYGCVRAVGSNPHVVIDDCYPRTDLRGSGPLP
jgi:hypothetical protein